MLAFELPSHALAFSAACQLELLRAPWPEELLLHPDGCAVELQQRGDSVGQIGSTGQCALRAGRAGHVPTLARWIAFCRYPRLAGFVAKLTGMPEAQPANIADFQTDSVSYSGVGGPPFQRKTLDAGPDSTGAGPQPAASPPASGPHEHISSVRGHMGGEDDPFALATGCSSGDESVSVRVFRRGVHDTVNTWGTTLSSMYTPASAAALGRASRRCSSAGGPKVRGQPKPG